MRYIVSFMTHKVLPIGVAAFSLSLIACLFLPEACTHAQSVTESNQVIVAEQLKELPASVHALLANNQISIEIGPVENSALLGACRVLEKIQSPIHLKTLSGASFSEEVCQAIAKISALRELDLGEAKVSNAGVSMILCSKHLREFTLPENTALEDVSGSMTWPNSLEVLDLNGSTMSEACWKSLAFAPFLHSLNAANHNRLAELPEVAWRTIRTWPKITTLATNVSNTNSLVYDNITTLEQLETLVLMYGGHDRMVLSKEKANKLGQLKHCQSLALYRAC